MRWLHPFFGIAPVKSVAPSTKAGEWSTSEVTWPIKVGRFSTLYVVTPLLVIAMSASIIYARIVMSNLAEGSQSLEISEAAMQSAKDRFRTEIAARSPEQNRVELESLQRILREARRENNESRVEILSVEISMIEEVLE